jgi:hypothetical protein
MKRPYKDEKLINNGCGVNDMGRDQKGEARKKVILAVMMLVILVSIIFTWSVLDAVTQYNGAGDTGIKIETNKETVIGPKVAVEIKNPNYQAPEMEGEAWK